MAVEKDALKLYSTQEVAKLLGVDATTVILWCKKDKLPAYKTPGGHRRIKAKDLHDFLKKYDMPIPKVLEKADQKKFLIVDDDALVREVIRRIIINIDQNAVVELVGDGYDAGKKALDLIPDLVVLDLNIPGIDGIKVCTDLKQDDRFRSTKILAITGENTQETRQKFIEAGADGFLGKPFDDQELEKSIRKISY